MIPQEKRKHKNTLRITSIAETMQFFLPNFIFTKLMVANFKYKLVTNHLMKKNLSIIALFLSIFILSVVPILGETATYNSTFEAPLCTSGDYTSGSPCTSGTLLNNYYTSESNYPNTIDECNGDSNWGFGTTYDIDQLVLYDTDGDGQLETGDTIQIQFDGSCSEGDDLYLELYYSLNPELGNSATWTLIDKVTYDPADVCGFGSYDETNTNGGFSIRTFTITGSPTYVAVRLINNGDSDDTAINGCRSSATSVDTDDLVLKMYQPPNVPTIISTNATNINQFNVTLESVFTYEDATWIDAYWVIDSVNQSKTNSTTVTTHNRTFVGLDWETLYEYKLCLDNDAGSTVCSSEKNFTTANRVAPYINIATHFDIEITEVSVGGTFFFEDFLNITAYIQIDGVNQTETLYTSGTSQYHSETITSLTANTNYTWDFCISYENGEICEGGDNFTTLDYIIPYINAINSFDITNHEASLGATVFYGSYENMSLSWVFGSSIFTNYYNQSDEFDISEYYSKNLTTLNYSTTYNYSLDITYIDPNGLGAGSSWIQEYRCEGISQRILADENGAEFYWSDLNSRRITSKSECADLCNRFIGNPLFNNGTFGEGEGCCYYVDNTPYDECIINRNITYEAGASAFWSEMMNDSANVPREITGSIHNFTTDAPYPPYITNSIAINITGVSASLTGTYYVEDYPSVVPFFRLDGIDLLPKENETIISEPAHYSYNLTGLSSNTTYNYTFCVGYNLGWANLVCDSTKIFTTPVMPIVTFNLPTFVNANDVTLNWIVDWDGTTNVTYKFKGVNPTWLETNDKVPRSYFWDSLEAETNYTYWLTINYTYLGTEYQFQTPDQYVTTYYENAFDDIWDTLLQGSSFAKILLGFVVLFGIVFLGAGAFGKYNLQLGFIGILVLIIIGTVIAGLMKLFPISILLLVIGGTIILLVLKNMFFRGEEDR